MKIFLSSRYSRRDELREVRKRIIKRGFQVVSRWLDTEWEEKDGAGSSSAPAAYREEFAIKDMEDVERCDLFIGFTEEPRSDGRGGRHVEFGAAVALGKRVWIIGPHENIFHHLPRVCPFGCVDEMLTHLEFESRQ